MVTMLFVQFLEKKIFLDKLNYWNVDLQEPYFSHVEASQKRDDLEKKNDLLPTIMRPNPLIRIF